MSYRVKLLAAMSAVLIGYMAMNDYRDQQQREHEMEQFFAGALAQMEATEAYWKARTKTEAPRTFTLSDRSPCSQTAYFYPVQEGSNVWTVISSHVTKFHPNLTVQQHENEVGELVKFAQSQIDLTPSQTVKDLDVVPVGYMVVMTADNGIFLPGEGANR
jgi:hypothetical protein